MAGKHTILIFLGVLVYGVIGESNILPDNSSSEQVRAKHRLPVKTVTTEHGDIYDCIDFFDQPAFDHPLLKNHDYHFDMKPSYIPGKIAKTKERFKSKKVGCPRGTVPIRRSNTENLIAETPHHPISQTENDSGLIFYAGTQTKDGLGKIYGASSSLSIENPKIHDFNQFSSSLISIQAEHEFLHAGWTVNPKLYGDSNTRFYIWMKTADASCYNVNCPGFVIVDPNQPLDRVLKNANTTGEARTETKVIIFQDKATGNWWVVENNRMPPIGFWPKSLFSTLSDGAYKAYFGGAVGATPAPSPGKTSFPQMGNGRPPLVNKIAGNALSRQMMLVNQDGIEDYAASKSDILESLNERYVARNYHMHWYNRKKAFASTLLFGGS